MFQKKQKGQALILITLSIVGVVGLAALAIDGGNAFMIRRDAQGAADAAALAGALAKHRGETISTVAQARATSNGFTNNGTTNTVVVNNPPGNSCDGTPGPYFGDSEYVQVLITTTTETFFATIVGIAETESCVEAVARAKTGGTAAPFFGNAVVGLNPNGYGFDAWGNSDWIIEGSGVFTNDDAIKKNNKDNVTFVDGHCVTSVGVAQYFTNCTPSQNNSGMALAYPDDIYALLPPTPPCDGVAYRGGDGRLYEQVGYEGRGSIVDHFEDDYAPGLYCITNANGNMHGTTSGTGVTFYIMDPDFTLRFNGGGGFAVSAPTSGTYKGILMFSGITASPCTQDLEYRGNGTSDNVGTIFLPSACIDVRGNGSSSETNSQIIGYTVSSNGTGDVYINYNDDDNYQIYTPATIELTQ